MMLNVENLKTWYPIRRGIFARTRGYVRAVDGVSLTLDRGQTLGLVGESGCGKTTLGRSILGLEKIHAGRITFDGNELGRLPAAALKRLRRKIQIVFQDPLSSLNPRMNVLDIITEGLCAHALIDKDKASAAAALLADVGLNASDMYRYPHEFSGGQRQRISIARAVSLKPDLMVCDEPVSALDVSVQAQIINLLMDLGRRYQLSYLFISHDLSVVSHISDRIAVMYLGRIVEHGTREAVIGDPRHPYTRALIAAVPVPGAPRRQRTVLSGSIPSPSNPPPGCPFNTRCPSVKAVCRRRFPPETGPADHRVSCHLYG